MSGAEFWSLVDRDGVPTGAVRRRDAVDWPTGAFRVVATVCCVRPDGRVLLTRRAGGKSAPGTWEFPGGSALAGESSLAAAKRELREETGLVPEDGAWAVVGRFVEERALVDLHVARTAADARLHLDPSEVAGARWVDLRTIDRYRAAGGFRAGWEARVDALLAPLAAALEGDRGARTSG